MAGGLAFPFIGALQASLSVLLIILYGFLSAQASWLSQRAAKDISLLCVKLLLPALLLTNIGSNLTLETGWSYVPVFIWSIIYNSVSIAIGVAAVKLFKLPPWVAPAVAFNNTTSLPLILIQSLSSTGIFNGIMLSGDSSIDVVNRANSYFLVNSIVGNCLTFGVGTELLNAGAEDVPDSVPNEKPTRSNNNEETNGERRISEHQNENESNDVETGTSQSRDGYSRQADSEDNQATESTSLLPENVRETIHHHKVVLVGENPQLPPFLKRTKDILSMFINACVIAAIGGIIIGLVPPLHKACFNSAGDGGFLNAWLITSIKKIGSLFAALQTLTVGVKLSSVFSFRKWWARRQGEYVEEDEDESGRVPWGSMVFVEFIRNFLWPAISIPTIYAIATHTDSKILPSDPILWFSMMLMPVGPPALKLTALADVNGSSKQEKSSITKFLTISYFLSPIMAFAVVGSLVATEKALQIRGSGA